MKQLITLIILLSSISIKAQWSQLGGTVMDAGIPSSYGIDADPIYQKIAFHPVTGVMYVIVKDYSIANGKSGRPTVKSYDGSNWVTIGVKQFTPAGAEGLDMAIHPNTGNPYISFYDASVGGNISVMRYNSTTMNWEYVGTPGFASTPDVFSFNNDGKLAAATKIIINPNTQQPSVLFQKSGASDGASVMTYTGVSNGWINVGSEFVLSADLSTGTNDFAQDPVSGTLYVFASDKNQSGASSVFRLNGSAWQYVGNPGFTLGYGSNVNSRRIGFWMDNGLAYPTIAVSVGSSTYKHWLNVNNQQWENSPLDLVYNFSFPYMEFGDDPTYSYGSPYSINKEDLATNDGFRINYRVQKAGQFQNIGYDLDYTFPTNGSSGQFSEGHIDRSDIEYSPTDGLPYFLITSFSDDANKSIQLDVYSFQNSSPTGISLTANAITEGVPVNSTIGHFSSVDQDTYDSHAFSLVNGTGADDNASFTLFNNTILRSAEVFNESVKNTYNIRVRCEDLQGASFEQIFTINIVQENVLPTDILLDNYTILEGSGTSRLVGNISAVDANPADTHTFVEVAGEGDDGNAAFSITNGSIINSIALDASVQNEYTMRIRVYDGAAVNDPDFYIEKIINISVIEINDAPVVNEAIPNIVINEDELFQFEIAENTFLDDENDPLTFTAQVATTIPSPLPAWLNFNESSGVFYGTPLQEDVGTLHVLVIADDNITGTASDIFSITIENVNDAPIVDTSLIPSATQNISYLFHFGNAASDEDDIVQNLTYELLDDQLNPTIYPPSNSTSIITHTPQQSDVGDHNLIVRATDDGGAYSETPLTFTVHNANDAPTVINPISAFNVTANFPFEYQIPANTFEDVDGDELTYLLTNQNGNPTGSSIILDPITRIITFNLPPHTIGTTAFLRLRATDPSAATVFFNFHVFIVDNVNAPVVANPIPDQATDEDSPFNFQFALNTFSDADGDPLSFSAEVTGGSVLPDWLNFDESIRTFSGTPVNEDVGILSVTVTADDGKGKTGSDDFDITIVNTNDAPVILNTVGDQLTIVGGSYTFTFDENVFTDMDGDALTYSASKAPQGLADDSNLPAWLTFNDQTRTLTGTPSAADVGTITVRIAANDGNGGSITDEFLLEVYQNSAPTLANPIADEIIDEDMLLELTISVGTFSDIDEDPLTYSASLSDNSELPSWLSFNATTASFTGTPLNEHVGLITIRITVDDGNGGDVFDEFDLTINNTNDTPTAENAIPNQITSENELFSFQFASNTFDDGDAGDQLTYSLANGSLPSWLTFTAATRTFEGTPSNADIGELAIEVIAADLANEQAVTDFTITVQEASHPPTVANPIANQDTDEDALYSYTFAANTFTDLNEDVLTYTASLSGSNPLPTWLTFNATTRSFSGTPTNENVTTIAIHVTADDGNGGTAIDIFDLTINNINDVPTVANPIAAISIDEDELFDFQFPENTFADIDGDVLTYSATLEGSSSLPSWLLFDITSRTFSGTPLNENVGTMTIYIAASDGNGGNIETFFDLNVVNTNDAPIIVNAINDQTSNQGVFYNFTFSEQVFLDVDNDVLNYTAFLSDDSLLPTWITFNATTRNFSGTPENADVSTITISLTADDGNGGTASDIFELTINNINDVPTVSNPIGSIEAEEDVLFDFKFPENTFEDIDGDVLSYSATLEGSSSLPSWLTFDAASRTFSGTPLNENVGIVTIYITANDGNGGIAETFFDLNVFNANDAPIIVNAINDQTSNQGVLYNFTFSEQVFSDIDNDVLNYTAFLSDASPLPTWITFNAATRNFSGTPANEDVSTITINLIANDGNGGMAADIFDLTINNINDLPTVNNPISSIEVEEDILFDFQFPENTFEDIDGDILTYSATLEGSSSLPSWLMFDATSRTFSGTPLNENVGTVTIYIAANDGNGGNIETFFDLNVVNTNDAPSVRNPIEDQITGAEEEYHYQFDEDVFNDVDQADNLTYTSTLSSGSSLPNWLKFETATRTFSGTPSTNDISAMVIKLIATDLSNASTSDEFELTIIAPPLGLNRIANSIGIFPNPTESVIYLSIPAHLISKMSITIYTQDGSEVKKLIIENEKNPSISLDDLKSGLYLLQIEFDNETAIKRFIKK